MSWAALARKIKDEAPEGAFDVPKQIVLSIEERPADDPKGQHLDVENVRRLTIADLPPYNKGLLILDTNAFIKGLDDYVSLADALVTVPQVVQEIKDRASRELLERLPIKLVILDPSTESIRRVMDMAAKTGDAGAMSRTDVRLCALALECCMATNTLKDSIVPSAPKVNPKAFTQDQSIEEVREEVSDDEEQPSEAQEEDDGEGEWITSTNIKTIQSGSAAGGNTFDGGVACATSDFPMQNTLLHLGVPIIGPRGMRISELRLWLLRCHSCYCIVHDTTRQFCPDCGSGDTLRRVNYVVQENGEKQLFINFKRNLSTRGTKYNLPKPRGGKNGTNRGLVLREDQLAHVIRGGKTSHQAKTKIIEEDDDLAAFGEATERKKFDISKPKEHSSYHRYNVTERKKAKAGTKK